MMLLFHIHVCKVLTSYFGELNEEAIRDNFVIIYELLDELMDFGYPQSTDEKILKEYITQEGSRAEVGLNLCLCLSYKQLTFKLKGDASAQAAHGVNECGELEK